MRVRGLVAAVLAGVALVATTALPARAAREVSSTYVAGRDPLVSAFAKWAISVDAADTVCPTDAATPGIGGTCFAVEPGDTAVRVRIVDAGGLPVSGTLSLVDAAGDRVARERFCVRTEVPIPTGAVAAVVGVDTTMIGCDIGGGVGTTGTVVAFFS